MWINCSFIHLYLLLYCSLRHFRYSGLYYFRNFRAVLLATLFVHFWQFTLGKLLAPFQLFYTALLFFVEVEYFDDRAAFTAYLLDHIRPYFSAYAQKRHYFYFRSEFCCHHRSERHRPIKVPKFWRFDYPLVGFGDFLLRMRRNGNFWALGYNSDNPIGFSDPDFLQTWNISNIRIIHFWQILPRNLPYFCFRSTWSDFLKADHILPYRGGIIFTKFKADPNICYWAVTLLLPIRYVTLWPWRLTFDLERLLKIFRHVQYIHYNISFMGLQWRLQMKISYGQLLVEKMFRFWPNFHLSPENFKVIY